MSQGNGSVAVVCGNRLEKNKEQIMDVSEFEEKLEKLESELKVLKEGKEPSPRNEDAKK